MGARVAIVHDYLTQRGGAERVLLSMLKAFPGAPVYTSLYDPGGTFPAFGDVEIRTLRLNRLAPLRRNHRLAFPVLAPAFSRLHVDADVVLCSSSGWAHGIKTTGRKVVYCFTPARWLYQTDRYLGEGRGLTKVALAALRPYLTSWDRAAARTADRYLTLSTVVRESIRAQYGIEAEVLPPSPTIDVGGPRRRPEGIAPGFFLCVSRLLPYKNVDAVVRAFRELPDDRLVVVGTGPLARKLEAGGPANVSFTGAVGDDVLRWLYANSAALIAASYEDYGLTPLEANLFGRPALVLRGGGYLDTLAEGVSGLFFDAPEHSSIAAAVRAWRNVDWFPDAIARHADAFTEERFVERLRRVVLG